jgi:hypothetical protein
VAQEAGLGGLIDADDFVDQLSLGHGGSFAMPISGQP